MIRKYIYGPGTCPPFVGRIDEPICMIDVSTGSRYYYFCDGLGSVVALLHNSAVVEMYFYDAFGRTLIYNFGTEQWSTSSSFFGNRFMFTGREFDAESRLYYYRARMYHPGIGRFLQTDPIGYADSMNLYAYCLNGPANFPGLLTVAKTAIIENMS